MRSPSPSDPAKRRMRGFEPAAGLLSDRIRKAGESRGFAVSRLLTHWPDIAGPDLARITRPVKIGYGREGMGATLTLLVAPAHAPMVQMALPTLTDRVNAVYGYAAIKRITLTQTSSAGFAEGQTPFQPASAKPGPDPALQTQAAMAAAPIQDSTLRAALEALGTNILSRRKATEGNQP